MNDSKSLKKSMIFIGVYILFNIYILFKHSNILSLWLCWNLILGFLPLIFISIAQKLIINKKPLILILIFMLLWLFFFPNSIYLVTDYIHLQNSVFYETIESPESEYQMLRTYKTEYKYDISIWIELISISIGFIMATYFGIKSLDIFLNIVTDKFNEAIGVTAFIVVSFLSGIGIYIGRFLRFNSWNILNPFNLISSLLASLEIFSYKFIFLFMFYIIFLYIFYKIIIEKEESVCRGCF